VADLFDSEQVQAREMLVPLEIGRAKTIKVAGNPIKLESERETRLKSKVPGLDEHRELLLAEFSEFRNT
jgi:CoA:oxalate CoA-transferase